MRDAARAAARLGLAVALALDLSCASRGPSGAPPPSGGSAATADAELESLRWRPLELEAFLRAMPKGADLHLHLSGAVYAERYIDYAASDGACFDRERQSLVRGECDAAAGTPPAAAAFADPTLYAEIVDALSMRNWNPARISGHDQFFSVFRRFGVVSSTHQGEMVADVRRQAARDRLSYVEAMVGAGNARAAEVARKVAWSDDLDALRAAVEAAGLEEAVAESAAILSRALADSDELLGCGGAAPEPGCGVELRFIHEVGRANEPVVVFAQMLLAFETATHDPHVSGINLVMPEDYFVARRDFDLHMRLLDHLHAGYPGVRIALHAGELAPGLVPATDLRDHIRKSIELGHAERIGHGVDVMQEDAPGELLAEMAKRGILVEVCLTSNDVILGIGGDRHPLPAYRRAGVPVALATDDPGVARSDMTREWLRAASTYRLTYRDLVAMARASLRHAFLPGADLWESSEPPAMVPSCRDDDPRRPTSAGCTAFLTQSPRATHQWRLEADLAAFEDDRREGRARRLGLRPRGSRDR